MKSDLINNWWISFLYVRYDTDHNKGRLSSCSVVDGSGGVEYPVSIVVINGILLSGLAAQRKHRVLRISAILMEEVLSPASGELFS